MGSRTNVLLIGGGGREHALAMGLAKSAGIGDLWTSHPGNPGLASLCKPVDVPVEGRELYRLEQFCEKKAIGLVVIGPEDPLAEGYADRLRNPTRLVFGPDMAGAKIESDKSWCKQLLRSASIPTGEGRTLADYDAACQYVESRASDDEDVGQVMERFGGLRDATVRRQLVDAMVRVGKARISAEAGLESPAPSGGGSVGVAAPTGVFAADLTLLKGFGSFKDQKADNAAVIAACVPVARAFMKVRPDLPVIKATGLAKGKGVVVPATLEEAAGALDRMLRKREFGAAGAKVLIEERLQGFEVSVLAITDGQTLMMLPPCQDHKRLGDGDTGPNTGGMGALCPTTRIDDAFMEKVERDIMVPTLDALRREGIEYRGVLYAGIMVTPAGPKVLEFNARFGDPETQPIMSRLQSDLLEILLGAAGGTLERCEARWDPRTACTVVLASPGYPDKPRLGGVISGLDKAAAVPGVVIHHAGTKRGEDGSVVTAGGRVLGVTGLGDGLEAARATAYRAANQIGFEGKVMRRDIGVVAR